MKNFSKSFFLKQLEDIGLSEHESIHFICECLHISYTEFVLLENINIEQSKELKKCISKAKKRMPVNKILKKSYFYGREFFINNNVLAPRLDTELVVEKALKEINDIINATKKNTIKVLDLCTGSGIIGITIRLENNNATVDCSDISAKALKVAKKNSISLNADVTFIKSNLFDKIIEKYDIIVSNPPYISKNEYENLSISVKKYDPYISLVAKDRGLDIYKRIQRDIKKYLNENGVLVLEIGYNQGAEVAKIFEETFSVVKVYKDYNNNDRIVIAKGVKNVR